MGEENSEVSSKSSLTVKNKRKQGFLYSGHFTDKEIGPMYSNNMRQGDNFDSLGIRRTNVLSLTRLSVVKYLGIFSNLSVGLGGRKTNVAIRSHTIPIFDNTAKDPNTQHQDYGGMKRTEHKRDVPK